MNSEEIRFDIMTTMEKCLWELRELRTADLGKRDFLKVLSLFSEPLAKLLWAYYRAEE